MKIIIDDDDDIEEDNEIDAVCHKAEKIEKETKVGGERM